MKQFITTILLSLITINVSAQNLQKTYYDIWEKEINEVYYANSAGYGNGSYKKYDRKGVLIENGKFTNGKKTGEWIKYTTASGQKKIDYKETYKDHKLHGPAIYYFENQDGRVVQSKGEFIDGEKNGKWECVNRFYNRDFEGLGFTGAKFIKFNKFYLNGKEIIPDGEHKIYYLPSKKLQSISHYLNEVKTGEWKFYFPDGKVQGVQNYKDGKKVGKQIEYNFDGTIKVEQFFEDFEALSDLYLDSALTAMNNYEFEEAEKLFTKMKSTDDANRMKYMSKAVSLRGEKKYLESIEQINIALKGIQNPTMQIYWQEVYKDFTLSLDSNFNMLVKYESLEGLQNELKKCQNAYNKGAMYKVDLESYTKIVEDYKLELKRKEEELKQLNIDVNSSVDSYKSENIKQIETLLIDATTGKHIMKEKKVKGKYLFDKSMIVLNPLVEEFNAELDLEKKKILGKKITDTIEVLNKIPESEWKALNKQLKKIDDQEAIKAILKI